MLKLRLLTGPRAGRQLRVSDTKPVSIGRRKGRLRLHDSRVSKNHAEIHFDNNLWILRDLGSANGTYVNRHRVKGLVELETGDIVQMGRVLFKIVQCDTIGMDAQGHIPDTPTQAEMTELASRNAEPSQIDDDFDLGPLLGDSPDHDLKEDSSTLQGIDAALDVEGIEQTDADADEDLGGPRDDHEWPFAAQSEAANITAKGAIGTNHEAGDSEKTAALQSGIDDSDGLNPNDSLGPDTRTNQAEASEATDPFLLAESEPTDEETGDLITLGDESGADSPSAGTTLLATMYDSPTPTSEPEQSDTLTSDQGNSDQEDDEPPALVGLALDHAPPQQPIAPSHVDESLTEPVQTEDANPQSTTAGALEPDQKPAELVDDAVADEALAGEIAFTLDDDLDDFDQLEGSALFDALDLRDPEPEPPTQSQSPKPEATANPPAVDDSQTPAPLIEPMSGFVLPLNIEPPAHDSAVADAIDDESKTQHEPAEKAPPALASASGDAPDADGPDQDTGFDIDAAFDALSDGLDNSVLDLPAATGEPSDEAVTEQADEKPQPVQPPQDADSLIGSQLDVGFIQDALSQIEEDNQQPPQDDQPPKGSTATADPIPPPIPPTADDYLQSPPPGLASPGMNPTSVNLPEEPSHSPSPRGGRGTGRWFFTLLLFLGIGGVGGWFINQNYERLIGSRTSPDPADLKTPANPLPSSAASTEARTELPLPRVNPTITEPTTPKERSGPNPFSSGPAVIGSDALQGLFPDSRNTPPADTIKQGTPDTPAGSDHFRTPDLPTIDSAIFDSQDPVPSAELIEPPPIAEQKPARIVFLVDASGSLVDSLPQMVVWLNKALLTVKENEQFAIYFFKSGQPIATKPEGMLKPSRQLLAELSQDWLNACLLYTSPSPRDS